MTQNKGTLVVSPIRPINGDLNIPVAYAEEVRGGWHSVDTISDRDLISEGRRKFGMIVYIKNDDVFYQLKEYNSATLTDNLNWVQINLVQSGNEWVNSVLSQQGTPPGSPSDGDRYLITVGTGIWTAYSGYIAEYLNSSWIYTAPTEGMTVRVDDEPGPIYVRLGGVWTKQEFVGDAQYPYYTIPVSTTLNVGTGSEYLIFGDLTLNGDINNNGKVVVLNGSISGGGTISGAGLIQQVNLLTDVIAGVGITISSTSSTSRTVSTNIIAGTGIYLSQNGNQLDISTLPQLVSPSYFIQANEKIEVPDWKEYFIYGDLTVYGELDIADDGKVVVVNGNLIVATGATVTNLGNVELYQLITAADDNLKIDITEIRYGTPGRILYESELKWIPLYGTYARVLTEDSKFVYSTSSAYSTSTASSFENYMGIGTSDPLKKLHIHNSGLLIDGPVAEQESGLGNPNPARLTIDSENNDLQSLVDTRNDYGTVFHVKGSIDSGNRFPSVSIGTSSTNGLFQINDYYGLNSFYVDRNGNVGLHTLSPSFSTHIVGDLRIDLGSDSNYDLLIRGASSKLERIPHGLPDQVFKIPADGATPSWATFSGGGSIVSIDSNEIAFGTGIGLTSSDIFTFDPINYNLFASFCSDVTSTIKSAIIGGQCNSLTASNCSVLFGGGYNVLYNSNTSTILNGSGNNINISNASSIIGGYSNVTTGSIASSIIGGSINNINSSDRSSIIGGCFNNMYNSTYSSMLGGSRNGLTASNNSSVIGGYCNNLNTSNRSSIIGGFNHNTVGSQFSSIIGGGRHNICSSVFTSMIGGYCNGLTASNFASIIGGNINCISSSVFSSISGGLTNNILSSPFSFNTGYCNSISSSCSSGVISGKQNTISLSRLSTIIGGQYNQLNYSSNYSSIVGGFTNMIICGSFRSSIIGGYCGTITNNSFNSSILGGFSNIIDCSSAVSILGGGNSNINTSNNSSIIGGDYNEILNSNNSSLLGGYLNCVSNSVYSSTIVGFCNKILNNSPLSVILGGQENTSCCSRISNILGGRSNYMYCSGYSSIISGTYNKSCFSQSSSIINSYQGQLYCSPNSSIQSSAGVGLDNSTNSLILGMDGLNLTGSGLTFSNRFNNTIVQDLTIVGSMSTIILPNEYFGITGTFSSPTQIVVVNGIIISVT